MNEFESDWISWVRIRVEGECFWVNQQGKNRCLIPTWQKLNPRWQNSWLQNSWWPPSSSWVRMNEFESDWISLSQNQSGGRVFLSKSGRKIQGVSIPWCRNWIQDSRIQKAKFKMATIIKLSQNEWVSFFVQMVGREVWVKFFLCKWWEPILASMSVFERKN